ncbi:hypothetical protein G2912_23615 [Paraburkholderia aspalathi]|nr:MULTISPECIES: hypothetical protein [Paraburkholderia]MBK3813349.1 hypothetical protein [Paraburkholderia aspalathi]
MRLLSAFILLCSLVAGSAHAEVNINSCTETWHNRTPASRHAMPFAFYSDHEDFKVDRTAKCLVRKTEMRGIHFAVFGGRAYYVQVHEFDDKPSCGQTTIGTGPVFDPLSCYVPHQLRVVKNAKYVDYYPISDHGIEFRLIDELATERTDPEIQRAMTYATDGISVFHLVDDWAPETSMHGPQVFIVDSADPSSFHTFSPDGASKFNLDWARDDKHLYYGGKLVSGVSPSDAMQFFGDNLVVIGGRVFGFDGKRLLPRPDVRPTLTMISQDFIGDGVHIYLRTGELAKGFRPNNFRILTPSCPVPGNPEVKCVQEGAHINDAVQVHVGVGDGGLVFDTGPEPYRVTDVDPNDVVYFKVQARDGSNYYMAISKHHLYLLQSSSRAQYPYHGRALSGPLKGPDAEGYMSDGNNRFWVHSSSWE